MLRTYASMCTFSTGGTCSTIGGHVNPLHQNIHRLLTPLSPTNTLARLPAPGSPAQACTRAACRWYTSHYCEENTLRLCRDLIGPAEATGVELFVVFISNHARQVPVWCQSLADSEYEPVLWDYHGESSLPLSRCVCFFGWVFRSRLC